MDGDNPHGYLSTRMKRWIAISIALSIISILIVVILTVDVSTLENLRKINPTILILALGLHSFSYVVWAARMKVMSSSVGTEVSLVRSTEIVLSNLFVAAITPSMAGGEPVRIHLLNRDGMPLGNATAVVIGERVLDVIFLIAAVPFAFFVFYRILSNNLAISSLFAVAAVLIVVLIGLLSYAMFKPDRVKELVRRAGEPLTRRMHSERVAYIFEAINREIDNFSCALWGLFRDRRKGLIQGLMLTAIFWVVEFALVPIILVGLGANPSVIPSYAAQVILMFVVLIPLTPGSSGLTELAASTLFATFVVPLSVLGVFIVIWRAITYHMNLLIGAFVSIKILKDTEIISDVLERF